MKRYPGTAWFFFGWLVILTLLPFALILGMSVMERTIQGTIHFTFTLENYLRCFHWLYAKVFGKTVLVAATATFSCLLIGFPVAYHLARSTGARRQVGLVLLFIPFWTNFILRVHAMVSLFGNHGLLNHMLLELGLIEEPIQILYTRTGVYFGLIYNYLPFLVIPIFSALEKLDPSFREAAMDLGANRSQTFWRVTLPNVREGVVVGSLFVFIPMLGEYVIPDLLGGAKEVFLGNVMVSQFFTMQDWPFGAAIAGLLSLILLVALFMQTRWQRRVQGVLA
ncbi:MAG: ABC transporter permease [Deltaproteobacteria bacterium]|nr:ABC transporter permease [Deltaproteobacteria bacterium]MBI3293448.1 ABC transporter permease [Deltaproteobacteria bacterium]